MEYIKEYKKILKDRDDFVVKSDEEIFGLETKIGEGIIYIHIINTYYKNYGDNYTLVVEINKITKTVLIYEDLDSDAQINYLPDHYEDEFKLYKKIIKKTIELSKKNNLKKIITLENLRIFELENENRDFLKENGFKYLEKKKRESISLKMIQMIIVKKTDFNYNNRSKLKEDEIKVMNILKEVKLIYKSNKELIDFKTEMEKAGYWKIIEQEVYIILGVDSLSSVQDIEGIRASPEIKRMILLY